MVFGVGHCGACGFFFFFGLSPVLKGVVGCGWVWCLGRGHGSASWDEVGCWSWIGELG